MNNNLMKNLLEIQNFIKKSFYKQKRTTIKNLLYKLEDCYQIYNLNINNQQTNNYSAIRIYNVLIHNQTKRPVIQINFYKYQQLNSKEKRRKKITISLMDCSKIFKSPNLN